MSDIKVQIKEWHLELENIFEGYNPELNEVTELIKSDQHIAAFNYVDQFIGKNGIITSEKYNDITTDLYLSLT